jgi:hydroxymethylpyrimidine/phosphomethylpyrimidine kinase
VTTPTALTIAGSDSSGGAGIAADLKTFAALGVWGRVAVTAVTAQDSSGVHAIEPVSGGVVVRQIETALSDGAGVGAVKVGMLANLTTARSVADVLVRLHPANVVLDPVLRSSSGASLVDGGSDALLALLPSAALVTPNLDEAAALLSLAPASSRDEMVSQATALSLMTRGAAMVTGGHLTGDEGAGSADVLVSDGGERVTWFEADRIPGGDLHGTGCVLSAAIAAELAKGLGLVAACRHAKAFVTAAIERGVAAGLGSVSP